MSSWSLYYNTFFDFISTDITFLDQIKHLTRKQVWEGVNWHFQGVCFFNLLLGHHHLFIGLTWFVCKSERIEKTLLSICRNSVFPNFLFHISFIHLFVPLSLWISTYIVNKWMSCNFRDMRQQAIMIIYTWKYFPCPFLLPLFNFAESL